MLAFLDQAFLTLIVLVFAPFCLVYGVVSLREGRLFAGAMLLSAGATMAFFGLLACGGIKVRPSTRWLWAGFMALPWVVLLVGLVAQF
jgi:hypothetical protein